jgi:hypothetical protein
VLATKQEVESPKKTGWLMTVELVTGSTNELVRKAKFLLYPKKSNPGDALLMIAGLVVLEVIAMNSDASYPINLRQTEPLVAAAISKELLDEPAYCETDDWRCMKLSLFSLSRMRKRWLSRHLRSRGA